jgi:arylsulfatase A-like enzyme
VRRASLPVVAGLDAFAREALVFERAIAPMATTLPVHVSLFTSTNPSRHRVFGNFAHLRTTLDAGSFTTLAQLAKAHGYYTAAFVSAAPLKRHAGLAAGFDVYDEPRRRERRADATIERAVRLLRGYADRRPILLWVHLFDPHDPYEPPIPYDTHFRDEPGLDQFMRAAGITRTPEGRRIHNLYDGEIRFLDQQLGRLFEVLETAGILRHGMTIVTADHGEGLGQHGWAEHGRIYNEQIRVPLIIRFPGAEPSRVGRRSQVVTLIDVLPTIAEVAGWQLSDRERAQLEGHSLLDDAGRPEFVLSERTHHRRSEWGPGVRYALTSAEWKLIHWTHGPDELYRLSNDHHETRNVLGEYPAVASRLSALLQQRLASYGVSGEVDTEAGAHEVPGEITEQLRNLGYVR